MSHKPYTPSSPSLTKYILEHLAKHGNLMIDAFLFPRSGSWDGMLPSLYPRREKYHVPKSLNKHSLSSTLWRLKKDGLVTGTGPKKKMLWKITKLGRQNLKKPDPIRNLTKLDLELLPEDGIMRLVTFDIPEREREKRNWLRAMLIGRNFKKLQQSVFIGKRPLPEELIREIEEKNLGECVHVMSIDKTGTIPKKEKN